MFRLLTSLLASGACVVMLAGCDRTASGSAHASADKAAKDAKAAQEKSEKDLKDQQDAAKAKADKEAKEKDAADKLAASRQEETTKLAAAKTEFAKLYDLPKVEDAISKLPDDKKKLAQGKLADFKKMWGDFMNENDSSKLSDWKDKLTRAYNDLTKASGM